MHVKKDQISATRIKLTISPDNLQLNKGRQLAIKELGKSVKISGFRPGKAPAHLIEKYLDPFGYRNTFLQNTIEASLSQALTEGKIKNVSRPEVIITKYNEANELEFEAEFDVLGDIKLIDYTKIKLLPKKTVVSDKDIDETIEVLRTKLAEFEDVQRKSKLTDRVIIDFQGFNYKTKEEVKGAHGESFPLVLGSNSFIKGFEENLVGLKTRDKTSFTVTFPSDYDVALLKNRKVTFNVTIIQVQKVIKPKIDDQLAKMVGLFESIEQLKEDIKQHLKEERTSESLKDFNTQLLQKIIQETDVEIPKSLIDFEGQRLLDAERRNLVYRGETWKEHLKNEGLSEEEHKKELDISAKNNIIASLSLSEIAKKEGISLTSEEIDQEIQYRQQLYNDREMSDMLKTSEARKIIADNLLVQKTINKVRQYTEANNRKTNKSKTIITKKDKKNKKDK